jgi:hypothetical protein
MVNSDRLVFNDLANARLTAFPGFAPLLAPFNSA